MTLTPTPDPRFQADLAKAYEPLTRLQSELARLERERRFAELREEHALGVALLNGASWQPLDFFISSAPTLLGHEFNLDSLGISLVLVTNFNGGNPQVALLREDYGTHLLAVLNLDLTAQEKLGVNRPGKLLEGPGSSSQEGYLIYKDLRDWLCQLNKPRPAIQEEMPAPARPETAAPTPPPSNLDPAAQAANAGNAGAPQSGAPSSFEELRKILLSYREYAEADAPFSNLDVGDAIKSLLDRDTSLPNFHTDQAQLFWLGTAATYCAALGPALKAIFGYSSAFSRKPELAKWFYERVKNAHTSETTGKSHHLTMQELELHLAALNTEYQRRKAAQ